MDQNPQDQANQNPAPEQDQAASPPEPTEPTPPSEGVVAPVVSESRSGSRLKVMLIIVLGVLLAGGAVAAYVIGSSDDDADSATDTSAVSEQPAQANVLPDFLVAGKTLSAIDESGAAEVFAQLSDSQVLIAATKDSVEVTAYVAEVGDDGSVTGFSRVTQDATTDISAGQLTTSGTVEVGGIGEQHFDAGSMQLIYEVTAITGSVESFNVLDLATGNVTTVFESTPGQPVDYQVVGWADASTVLLQEVKRFSDAPGQPVLQALDTTNGEITTFFEAPEAEVLENSPASFMMSADGSTVVLAQTPPALGDALVNNDGVLRLHTIDVATKSATRVSEITGAAFGLLGTSFDGTSIFVARNSYAEAAEATPTTVEVEGTLYEPQPPTLHRVNVAAQSVSDIPLELSDLTAQTTFNQVVGSADYVAFSLQNSVDGTSSFTNYYLPLGGDSNPVVPFDGGQSATSPGLDNNQLVYVQ